MKSSQEELARLTKELLERVERLHAPSVPCGDRVHGELRENILLAIRTKILPELRTVEPWPVFVGVQGGTNVGKSTVFNALAGQILSPAIVQASATKHPLVFLHERWRETFLRESVFPDLECTELEDPRQLIVEPERTQMLYFRFHGNSTLQKIALIDSPDFDSTLDTNQFVARRVAAISDLTVFVTTAQKYKDRDLVAHLELLRELKATVVLVFNRVDEEIVFRTLVDDLRGTICAPEEEIHALRLGRSLAAHPEEEMRDVLQESLVETLLGHDPEAVKPLLLQRTLERATDQVGEWCQRLRAELEVKERIVAEVDSELERCLSAYAKAFRLALPEETLAVRRLLRETEISRALVIPDELARGKGPIQFVSLAIRRTSDFFRRLFLRLSYRSEGSIEETPAAIEEYAAARNEADLASVQAQADALRRNLEALLRSSETRSPLAREVIHRVFSPEEARDFPARVRVAYEGRIESRRREGGEDVLEVVDGWIEKHSLLRRALLATSTLVKVGLGVTTAWLLPPDGLLQLLNWIYFAVGFLLGAYAIALTVSWSLRRTPRFRKARIATAREVLETSTTRPVLEALEDALPVARLSEVEASALALRQATGDEGSRPA